MQATELARRRMRIAAEFWGGRQVREWSCQSPGGPVTCRAADGGRSLRALLTSAFLPDGWPASVTPDYAGLQRPGLSEALPALPLTWCVRCRVPALGLGAGSVQLRARHAHQPGDCRLLFCLLLGWTHLVTCACLRRPCCRAWAWARHPPRPRPQCSAS